MADAQQHQFCCGMPCLQATVEMFGSQAAGSAIHSSDMDLVVLNLAQPPPAGGGYPKAERPRVKTAYCPYKPRSNVISPMSAQVKLDITLTVVKASLFQPIDEQDYAPPAVVG